MLTHRYKTFVYNLFLRNPFRDNKFPFKNKITRWIDRSGFSIKTKLHGRSAVIPSGYGYPFTCRQFANFNNPLLELAWQTFQIKKEKLTIIDAGAAIGDTLYLLKQNLPTGSTMIYCIEGDQGFMKYLSENAEHFGEDAKVIKEVLSSQEELIPALIHHHSSSLIAKGEKKITALPLDKVWETEINQPPDILKTDLDGYDGKAIAGASEILRQFSPSVIFEFHPLLIEQTRNDMMEVFDVLDGAGYEQLLWFNKYGDFISQTSLKDVKYIQEMARQSLDAGEKEDIHFDLIAPGKRNAPDTKKLAQCGYAKTKKYPY